MSSGHTFATGSGAVTSQRRTCPSFVCSLATRSGILLLWARVEAGCLCRHQHHLHSMHGGRSARGRGGGRSPLLAVLMGHSHHQSAGSNPPRPPCCPRAQCPLPAVPSACTINLAISTRLSAGGVLCMCHVHGQRTCTRQVEGFQL